MLSLVLLLSGCAKKAALGPPPPDHPPHGGTVVEFGDGIYHLELLPDPTAGTMTAWFLDSELEEYIRAGAITFELVARIGDHDETLVFKPVASPATGETLTDTSQYEAGADWLKTAKEFDATLKGLTVRGTAYPDVKFNFPKGNDSG